MKLYDVVRNEGEPDMKIYEDVSIDEAATYADNNSLGMFPEGECEYSWFVIVDSDGYFRGHYFEDSKKMNVFPRY